MQNTDLLTGRVFASMTDQERFYSATDISVALGIPKKVAGRALGRLYRGSLLIREKHKPETGRPYFIYQTRQPQLTGV
jgi:predicted transcriptional regulator